MTTKAIHPLPPVLTSVRPRAPQEEGRPVGSLKRGGDWEAVDVAQGASLGARCVCVAPVKIGAWSLVAAGAVVTRDVRDYALVAGVPAKRIGWVGRAGVRLVAKDGKPGAWECPQTGELYDEAGTGAEATLTARS